MSLLPPETVGKLRQALHDKAKESPDYRFYSLYEKIYRLDVLWHAYYYSAESKMYQPQITRISLMKLLSRAIAVVDLAVRCEVDSFSSTKSVVIGEIRGYNPAL